MFKTILKPLCSFGLCDPDTTMPPSATKEEIYQRLISEIEKNKELKKKFDKSKIKSYEIANPLLGGQEFALIGEDLRTLFVMTGKKLNDIQTQWTGEF